MAAAVHSGDVPMASLLLPDTQLQPSPGAAPLEKGMPGWHRKPSCLAIPTRNQESVKTLLFFIFNPQNLSCLSPPVAVSRPCLSLPVSFPDSPCETFIKCHRLGGFWQLSLQPGAKEGDEEEKERGHSPPPRICFPGLCLGSCQRGSLGSHGKGPALFGWGCNENQGNVRSRSAAKPRRVPGEGLGGLFEGSCLHSCAGKRRWPCLPVAN